jgi:hypothetical protein
MREYLVRFTDSHPVWGGVTEVIRYGTRKEALWYVERELAAAKELGMGGITFEVRLVVK